MDLKEIFYLINSGREGSYWDFKLEWHANKASLLHDIICLANAEHKGDRYLIIGVDDPARSTNIQCVSSDANRKNQAQLIDFLREKPFLGGLRPEIALHTVDYEGKQVDVIEIFNRAFKPYTLTQNYRDRDKNVLAANVYTRILDTNTPIDKTTDQSQVEQMWRERFGLDLKPLEKADLLLRQPELWVSTLGSDTSVYCSINPEFQIVRAKQWEGREAFTLIFPNPDAWFIEFDVRYHSTVLFTELFVVLDGHKHYVPAPKQGFLQNEKFIGCLTGCHYLYYEMDTQLGAFVDYSADVINGIPYNSFKDSIIFFDTESERESFEVYVQSHLDELDDIEPSEAAKAMQSSDQYNELKINDCFNFEWLSKLKKLHHKLKEEGKL